MDEKLFGQMIEIGKDLKSLINTKDVLESDDKLLANKYLYLMLHVNNRTLQRYRTDGVLPFLNAGIENLLQSLRCSCVCVYEWKINEQ